MKLRNRKISVIAGQVPENENSSQVLASSVESVSCPDDLFEESSSFLDLLEGFSSLDGDRSTGERRSVSDVGASCPNSSPNSSQNSSPKNCSPLRTQRMSTRSQTNKLNTLISPKHSVTLENTPKHSVTLNKSKINIVLNKAFENDPNMLSKILQMECKVLIDKVKNVAKKTICKKRIIASSRLDSSVSSDLAPSVSDVTVETTVDREAVTSGLHPSASILDLEAACGSGEISNAQKCTHVPKANACKNCINFKPTNLFTSTVTHRTYSIVNHEKEEDGSPTPIH